MQFGRTWRKEFEDCETQIHCQDLHTNVWYVIMYLIPYNIIQDTYIYIKPMYNIEFCIILKTYIHTYARSILFNLNPNPNPKNLRKENLNLNLRNPRKELKSSVKPQENNEVLPWKMVHGLSWIAIQKLNKNIIPKCGNFKLWIFWWGKVIGNSTLVMKNNLFSQNTPHNNKFKLIKLSMKKLEKFCIGFLWVCSIPWLCIFKIQNNSSKLGIH
jgi:hypothetical protein